MWSGGAAGDRQLASAPAGQVPDGLHAEVGRRGGKPELNLVLEDIEQERRR